MKTFSLMSIPDLLLTKEAYLSSIIKIRSELALIASNSELPAKKLEDINKKLRRLKELHQAVCMEFPKMSLSEFHEWRKKGLNQPHSSNAST